MTNSFHTCVALLIFSQEYIGAQTARSLEPECGCASDLQLMYSFMEEKFTLKQEITNLRETLSHLASKVLELESDIAGRPRYIPGPYVNIARDYKVVSQSSEYSLASFPPKLAVDGNSNTFSHTGSDTNPWWSMTFCNDVFIAKVTLWNRSDCCDDQMANVVVTVDGVLCGRVDGAIGVGNSIDIICTETLVGKTLKIQRNVKNTILSIAEVQVFSTTTEC